MTWTWPSLSQLSTKAEDRMTFIGGSDANVILSGDESRIVQLWREKRGEVPPQDLSDNLSAMLGSWTEHFNRQWYKKQTGFALLRTGDTAVCKEHSWRRCTLDGFVPEQEAVWEAKHTNAFVKPDEVLDRYMPQLHHNMAVLGVARAVLSVIFGNHRFDIFEISSDWLYQRELLRAEMDFWDCVQTGRRPVAAEPPPAPKPAGVRQVCLEGNNMWASAAVDWLGSREAAKLHATAANQLKSLVDADVGRAFGHGVEAKRSKSGAITLREFV